MDPKRMRERLLRYGAPKTRPTGLALEDDAPVAGGEPSPEREEIHVRTASVKERGTIFKSAGVTPGSDAVDIGRLQAAATCLLACDSHGTRLFVDEDLEALLEAPLDSVVGQVGRMALEGLNVSPGEAEKN